MCGNSNTVKGIAKMLEDIVRGGVYFCPQCGEYYNADDVPTDEETDMCICPGCESDEIVSALYDYFEGVYGIEYRVDGKDCDYINSVRVMVACGGPNIYVDTADRKVRLCWWADYAEAEFSEETANAINEMFTELWNC